MGFDHTRLERGELTGTVLSMQVVSDNLRKGAALNAVQIPKLLGRRVLKKGDVQVHAGDLK